MFEKCKYTRNKLIPLIVSKKKKLIPPFTLIYPNDMLFVVIESWNQGILVVVLLPEIRRSTGSGEGNKVH